MRSSLRVDAAPFRESAEASRNHASALPPRLGGDLGGEIRTVVLVDALAEGEADEALQGDRLAGLRLRLLEDLGDRLRRVVHEGLLQEGDLLVVALEAALDDLLEHMVRLAGVLLAQDRRLALDRRRVDAGGVDRERARRRDMHGELPAERAERRRVAVGLERHEDADLAE